MRHHFCLFPWGYLTAVLSTAAYLPPTPALHSWHSPSCTCQPGRAPAGVHGVRLASAREGTDLPNSTQTQKNHMVCCSTCQPFIFLFLLP